MEANTKWLWRRQNKKVSEKSETYFVNSRGGIKQKIRDEGSSIAYYKDELIMTSEAELVQRWERDRWIELNVLVEMTEHKQNSNTIGDTKEICP